MSWFRSAFQALVYKGFGVALITIGILLLAATATASCVAWFYTYTDGFGSFPGYMLARMMMALFLGGAITVLTALLPFVVDLLWKMKFAGVALMAFVAWLCCLLVSWFVTVYAALEIAVVAALPQRFLTLLAAVWLGVEILAALLPVVGSATLEAGRVMRLQYLFTTSNNHNEWPRYDDLLELLTELGQWTPACLRRADIEVAADGTIRTSQSALGRCLGQAKSTINGRLRSLQNEGRIIVSTDATGTQIQLIGADNSDHMAASALSPSRRSGPNAFAFGQSDRLEANEPCAQHRTRVSPALGKAIFPSNAGEQAPEPLSNASNAFEFCKRLLTFTLCRWQFRTGGVRQPPRPG
jgi:hypothetical protein